MSAIASTVPAYSSQARYDIKNTKSSKNNGNADESPSPAVRVPQREVDLSQELDTRLSGEITRIRRQINPNTTAIDAQQVIGHILDIRV